MRNFSSSGATARRSAGKRWKIEPNTALSSSLVGAVPVPKTIALRLVMMREQSKSRAEVNSQAQQALRSGA
ncbi:hypothetical protein HZZ13_14630 [Bradyrhizobium sp. CNPSo 4010]|uniref:Uncharacterized protein n=1 Tax=Bradyrhizobium agreste TaxID=2751811 RepID=A0ABS0PP76_9BRAD|nr:hypothetical protein [Bradyrhizobium agreste]MBH5399007.1 hypothetical protein [Bradyrhizobium agreste]